MTIKKSELARIGLAVPDRWEIKVQKVGEHTYEMDYAEWINEGLLSDLAVLGARKIAEDLGIWPVDAKVEGNKLSWKLKGSLVQVANSIIAEFITASDLGDMTLRDLLIYAGAGRAQIVEAQPLPPEAAEKLKEIRSGKLKGGQTGELRGSSEDRKAGDRKGD